MNSEKDFTTESIRIGTIVNGGPMEPGKYIKQILPHGFESFSLGFWQSLGNANVKDMAESVKRAIGDSGAVISTLAIFGNPLEQGEKDLETLKVWETFIDNAHLFGADVVSGFTGRVRGMSIDKSIDRFKQVFGELAKRAAGNGVRIAFENCNMSGNWDNGDWNIAHGPAAWEMMFDAVPMDNLGLEWEPCHQMVKLVDPMPQLRKWAKRIFHVHGKDANVHWDIVRNCGILGPEKFAFHRFPGFGDCNWAEIISELVRGGFKGSIDIEGWHDPVYKGELEMTGQVFALNYLKRCRAPFAENPVE